MNPSQKRAFDNRRKALMREPGVFPHRCSRCGAVFEELSDLADPDKHPWPWGSPEFQRRFAK